LDQFKDEPHDYAAAVMLGITPSCESQVIQMLVDICRKGNPPPAPSFVLFRFLFRFSFFFSFRFRFRSFIKMTW
jgi:hypothetical protein